MVPLDTGWNWTPYFVSKTTPSTVSGYWLLSTRFRITLPTAIWPSRGSPRLSAEMILDSQYRSSAG